MDSVIRDFRITAGDGKTYDTKHYNLKAIIAIGYEVTPTVFLFSMYQKQAPAFLD